tara:strand:- start:404 stop:592 length:189 start_codon:yes stop_codon:yes gene_type:complete
MKSSEDLLSLNKKMIGKRVTVVTGKTEYQGVIIDVLDSETFQIKKDKSSKLMEVNIFDVRSA